VKCISSNQNITPESLALAVACLWLVFISCLHFFVISGKAGKDRIRIGFLPITCHLLLPVAMERNSWFRERVEPVKFSSWPDMIESIKGGELDAAFILAPIALSLIDQDVPVSIVLLGHRNGTGLVVSKKEPIRDGKDLNGKTIAIPIRFSTQNLALKEFLSRSHVALKNVSLVELPPPDMPSALASQAIDAYIVGEPYAAQAEMAGAGIILRHIQEIWPDFISSLMIVGNNLLADRTGLIDRIIQVLYSQGNWIESNRAEAARIGASFFGLPSDLLLRVLTDTYVRVSYRDLIPRQQEMAEIGSLMRKYGLCDHVPACRIYVKWQQET